MQKTEEGLEKQLELYDKICAQGRQRIIKGYFKYGNSYRKGDVLQDIMEEAIDIFNYVTLERMRKSEPRYTSKARRIS